MQGGIVLYIELIGVFAVFAAAEDNHARLAFSAFLINACIFIYNLV